MSEKKHKELLNVLKQSNSKIIISGYDNKLYNSELKDWFTDEKKTTAQMGLHRTEKIWMNFSPQISLFEYLFEYK